MTEAEGAGARLARIAEVLGIHQRTIQRWRKRGGAPDRGGDDLRNGPKTPPPNKLSPDERQEVLGIANSREFRDLSPKQIVPKLADRGKYVASESTFYRVLREEALLNHRGRAQAPSSRPPAECRATGPGQVWSWDITYLRTAVAGVFLYLYLAVDVWSRKIVAAEVHDREDTDLAAEMFNRAVLREGAVGVDLVVHADNGSPMKGATLKATFERLGVLSSFSRPRVSDDNPYSESLFRTAKYWPGYPRKPFDSVEQARTWTESFVHWYHHEHLHSGIRFVSPLDRHEGREDAVLANRRAVYEAAKAAHPERWGTRATRNWNPVGDVILNPSKLTKTELHQATVAA